MFQAALTRAPELRGAFLDEACSGDGALRREIDGLLAASEEAGGFLSSPIGLDTATAAEAARAGLHYRKSEYRAGLDLIGKARVIDEKLLAADPENPQAQVDFTFALNQLSWGHFNLGDLAPALAFQQESLAMREKILARNPGEARAQDQLAYALRAMSRLRRQTGDRAKARVDYERAHAIYTELRARGYGGAYAASELGITELELGELAAEEGRRAEACQRYRRSAAVYGELAARGAVLANHREDAETARRAAAACGP